MCMAKYTCHLAGYEMEKCPLDAMVHTVLPAYSVKTQANGEMSRDELTKGQNFCKPVHEPALQLCDVYLLKCLHTDLLAAEC